MTLTTHAMTPPVDFAAALVLAIAACVAPYAIAHAESLPQPSQNLTLSAWCLSHPQENPLYLCLSQSPQ